MSGSTKRRPRNFHNASEWSAQTTTRKHCRKQLNPGHGPFWEVKGARNLHVHWVSNSRLLPKNPSLNTQPGVPAQPLPLFPPVHYNRVDRSKFNASFGNGENGWEQWKVGGCLKKNFLCYAKKSQKCWFTRANYSKRPPFTQPKHAYTLWSPSTIIRTGSRKTRWESGIMQNFKQLWRTKCGLDMELKSMWFLKRWIIRR